MDIVFLFLVIGATVVAVNCAEKLTDAWNPAAVVLVAYFLCMTAIGVSLARRGVINVAGDLDDEEDEDDDGGDDPGGGAEPPNHPGDVLPGGDAPLRVVPFASGRPGETARN